VESLLGAYLDHLAHERGLARGTLSAYRRDLARYLGGLRAFGLDSLADVRTRDVLAYAEGLRRADARGPALSAVSIARAVAVVRGLHRFALREGVVGVDVAHDVRVPVPPAPAPRVLSAESVRALLDAASPSSTPYGARDRALLELLRGSGAGIGAAVALDLDDVDPARGLVRFARSGGRERVVPVDARTSTALDTYLVRARPELAASGYGFAAFFLNARGGRLSRQSGWAALKSQAEQAGLPGDVTPRALRHAFAAHSLDGGTDVRLVRQRPARATVSFGPNRLSTTAGCPAEMSAVSHPRALD